MNIFSPDTFPDGVLWGDGITGFFLRNAQILWGCHLHFQYFGSWISHYTTICVPAFYKTNVNPIQLSTLSNLVQL
jgi:hypothetical protein